MEWFTKAISALKIPLRILLPALWLFSGTLTLLNEEILNRLSLLEWKTENGFILGLIFTITSCLIIVYFLNFTVKKASHLIHKITSNRKSMKQIFRLSDAERSIIFGLYNSPGYSHAVDYNEPIIQGLLSRGYIYTGRTQLVRTTAFSNQLPIRVTLQPFVYQALDYYKPKLENEMHKHQAKAGKEQDAMKKQMLEERLANVKETFYEIYDNGGKQ